MDSLITAAARALAAGDPLGALKRVALRDDAPALALRGIAMAQLGDFVRAKALMRSAARAFGPKEAVARARCVVAEAEIALGLARPRLACEGARCSARDARSARRSGERRARAVSRGPAPPSDRARSTKPSDAREARSRVVPAGVESCPRAGRRGNRDATPADEGRACSARSGRARRARSGHPCADGGSRKRSAVLNTPAARLIAHGEERLLLLDEVEALLASKAFVVDACRHVVRDARARVSLATRPVLFALARALAEAWPGDVSRDALVARAFRARRADESYRARLRVEIGRLRRVLAPLAEVSATTRGFAMAPHGAREVVVLAPPVEGAHAAVLAFLADGESWSSSALALALGASQRTVQRSLDALAAAGNVQSFGRGRARRWMTPPVPGFPTTLLLPAPLPSG